jgi:protein phosphatase
MSSSKAAWGNRASIDRRDETGPFDIIGDVHGCADELVDLLHRLEYRVRLTGAGEARRAHVVPPRGRRAIFVGDLVDRGPNSPDCLRIVMDMVADGSAMCVPGNHDAKFMRWLKGHNVKLTHGLDLTAEQMGAEPKSLHERALAFIEATPLHLWLDRGQLVVAHAGIEENMIGSNSGRVREFCLYGDNDGVDETGLPIRWHWAAAYKGASRIVYGHTPVAELGWVNNTLCIDTGCCFGGAMTALRYPELELVTVPARREYAPPRRPFGHPPVRPEIKST